MYPLSARVGSFANRDQAWQTRYSKRTSSSKPLLHKGKLSSLPVATSAQTGYDVYCTVGGCNGSGWRVMGGTSAAAPVWAAMIALVNEASIKANGLLAGFLNPSLYAINHGAAGTSYATAFHDIVPVPGAI